MNQKKLGLFGLVMALMLSLSACGTTNDAAATTSPANTASPTVTVSPTTNPGSATDGDGFIDDGTDSAKESGTATANPTDDAGSDLKQAGEDIGDAAKDVGKSVEDGVKDATTTKP